MYGANVVRRLRPAASVSDETQPSVTNTASAGVFAAVHSAAARSSELRTWRFDVAVHPATSNGDGMLRSTTAAIAGIGQRWMNHAARIPTAIHIAWKYLFMSKSMTLTWTRFGMRKQATSHVPRNAPRGTRGMSRA